LDVGGFAKQGIKKYSPNSAAFWILAFSLAGPSGMWIIKWNYSQTSLNGHLCQDNCLLRTWNYSPKLAWFVFFLFNLTSAIRMPHNGRTAHQSTGWPYQRGSTLPYRQLNYMYPEFPKWCLAWCLQHACLSTPKTRLEQIDLWVW
jgi:hypothetical protein